MKPHRAASGIILAGGASRRMGRNKLDLTVGDEKLIHRVQDVLRGVCEEVLVVGAPVSKQRTPLEHARSVADLRPGRLGPLAGLEAGLAAARNDRVFVAAGDMPFLPGELVEFLLEILGERDVRVAVPRYGGRLHPLCAAYRRDVLTDLSFVLNLGVRAAQEFLESLDGVRHVEEELERFGDPEISLMNVNSPEDLQRARRMFERGEL